MITFPKSSDPDLYKVHTGSWLSALQLLWTSSFFNMWSSPLLDIFCISSNHPSYHHLGFHCSEMLSLITFPNSEDPDLNRVYLALPVGCARWGRVCDSHWRRSRRYTWGTFSVLSRSESSSTPGRTHGNTWWSLRPSCSPYMTDKSAVPVKEEGNLVFIFWVNKSNTEAL